MWGDVQEMSYICPMQKCQNYFPVPLTCHLFIFLLLLMLCGCENEKTQVRTPWGTTLGTDTANVSQGFSLDDIIGNGELIMLTINGPETYYDYRGRGMGLQYLLCEQFARQLGVSLRVELCKDTTEMVNRLEQGDGDIIAFPLPRTDKRLLYSGPSADSLKTQWAVRKDNKALADTLNKWFSPKLIAQVKQRESFLLSTRSVTRHVYSPMLNRSQGVISHYDHYFQQYAPMARWDWRLMAAQCYQESTFDPQARSWAGALGLMQIMPGTAAHLGLSLADIHDPEQNIAAAAKYLQELSAHFQDVRNVQERQYFVLASYNGGSYHVRDAMALTRKNGGNPHSWNHVSEYILKLSDPRYYRDPIVKHGYMRGSETVDYVNKIRARYAQYRGVAKGGIGFYSIQKPSRAKRKHRFKL